MKFFLPITTLIASALLATNVEAKWHAEPGLSWDYLIGVDSDSVIKSSNKDVVTIDLEKAATGLVSYFHEKGQRVICYFSGGTMQKARGIDYDDYKKANFELPKVSEWGNHYIDFRQKDKLQPLIKRRMQRALSYGCDGVEVDSIDHYNHNVSGYTKDDTITFGKWISETAHSVGIAVGLKNSAGCAATLEPYFDFAVVESCAESDNVCNNFAKFTSDDKAVFVVHYKEYGYKINGGSQFERLLNQAGKKRFSCVISDLPVHDVSESFDCTTGSRISGGSHKPITTTTTTTTTTTASATSTSTATPTLSGASNNSTLDATIPGNSTLSGNIGANNKNNTVAIPKEVGKAVGGNDNDKKEGGSGIGTVVAIVAAGGGVATAAVAGFVFLKKHKKFTSEDEEFNLENPKDEGYSLEAPKDEEINLEAPKEEEYSLEIPKYEGFSLEELNLEMPKDEEFNLSN